MDNQTMTNDEYEELLSRYEHSYKKGDLVKGIVYGFDSEGAIVEIGSKTTAIITNKEITLNDNEKINDVLHIGEEYEFLIIKEEDNEDGKFYLSRKRVEQAYIWKELEQIKENNEIIIGEIVSKTKGGLVVDIQGLKGFVPSSHLSIKNSTYEIGEKIELRILTIDVQQNNFVLSNKKALNDNEEETKQNLFSQIEIGQILKGTIVRITDFGAFIDLGGIDGLLPLSQMSWKWVEHPNDLVQIGDKIDVEVISIDKDKQRISLSLKTMQTDPWIAATQEIHEGSIVEGLVTRLKNFGAFIEVYNGVEALLPQDEVLKYQNEHNVILSVGSRIETKIVRFNPTDRRISLSINTKTHAVV